MSDLVVPKCFVCLCEDITVEELRSAIRRGYTDIEDVKRITGIGTGPCQGKQCLQTFRRLLAEETGQDVDRIPLTSLRSPLWPTKFGEWAGKGKREGGSE